MKIKDVKTGKVREVNAAAGLRLMEQGKAVAAKETPRKAADKKAEK